MKYRYRDYLPAEHPERAQHQGLWHSKSKELIQANTHAVDSDEIIVNDKQTVRIAKMFPKY